MARPDRLSVFRPASPLAIAALMALAALAGGVLPGAALVPAALHAQEPVPRDTARAPGDTLPRPPRPPRRAPPPRPDTAEVDTSAARDTGAVADTTAVPAAADTAADSVRAFPARLDVPPDARAAGTWVWGRRDLVSSSALSLLDFLVERAPGFTPLRASYFGGPHHLLDGVLGPGSVTVITDGRELVPLDGAQIDLTRISIAELERVELRRRADRWVLDLTTLRHDEPDAYSRVSAATGEPDVNLLRGVFVNGLGRAFAVGTAIDLLDVGDRDRPSDRFSLWGKLAWVPEESVGIELQYRNESLARTTLTQEEFNRRDLHLHGRVVLAENLQADAWAGTSRLTFGDTTAVEVRQGSVALRGRREWGYGGIGVDVRDGKPPGGFVADVEGHADAGLRVLPNLWIESSARLASRDSFDTSELYAGVRYSPDLGIDLALAVEGATGTRAVPYPAAATADTFSFDVAAGSAEVMLGPVRLGGRMAFQRIGRQLLFGRVGAPRPPAPPTGDGTGAGGSSAGSPAGSPADRSGEALSAGTAGTAVPPPALARAEVATFEGRFDAPIFPLALIFPGAAPIRAAGVGSHTTVLDGVPAFAPANLFRGEIYFHDEFFGGNLEVRLATGMDRRTAMLVPDPIVDPSTGTLSLETVPSRTAFDFRLMLRVDEVWIWWRVDNLRGTLEQDIPGFAFPVTRNVFGVKWQFFN